MKAQGFWSKAVAWARAYATKSQLKKLAPLLLQQVGVKATGFYVWLTTVALKQFVNWLGPWLTKHAYIFDRKAVDKKNLEELKNNETNGADSNEKVKDELNFLNGNKPNSK